MAILEVKHVDFRYGSGPWILKDISFSVEEGERVAILGPSGYGKSTLAKVIAGYLQPQGGEVLWEGKPLPSTGFCPIQLIYQHPEKALNPRWKMKDSLEEAGSPSGEMLDAINQAHIWNFVLSYAEKHNMTLLAITHNQYLADQVATRVLRIPELNHIQVDRSEL